MFRDRNHLMKILKMDLGVYSIKLPVSDKELFEDVIRDKTLMTFGIYAPEKYLFREKLSRLRVQVQEPNSETSIISNPSSYIYALPNDLFGDREILSINTITPYNSSNMMGYGAFYDTMDSYQLIAIAQGIGNLASCMAPPYSFDFIPPNQFRIHNMNSFAETVEIELNVMHHLDLHTIPMTARTSFYKLALLDMKIYLYNLLKHYTNIETAYGRIDLKIDDWQGAEGERNDLLEKWDDSYHLDGPSMYFA